MAKQDPGSTNLRDIVREITTPGYRGRARSRAHRTAGPAKILLIVTGFGVTGVVFFLLLQMTWLVHVLAYPGDADMIKALDGAQKALALLFTLPLLLCAIPIGLMLSNTIAWLLPPWRRALDRRAEGAPCASLRSSMRGLWMLARIMVPVTLGLSLIGALAISPRA